MKLPKRLPAAICTLGILLPPLVAEAASITADSCTREDVEAAIVSAEDGDTVVLPPETATWTRALILDSVPAITIRGSGIDQTVLINEVRLDNPDRNNLMRLTLTEDRPFRLTDLTLKHGESHGYAEWNPILDIKGTSQLVRIDHLKFDHISMRAISLTGNLRGVVDHCEITFDIEGPMYIEHRTWGGLEYGDGSWASPLDLGSEHAIFMEDNHFEWTADGDGRAVVDSNGGARWVFRHNTVLNTGLTNHGLDSGGRERGTFSYEIYDNVFDRPNTPNRHTVFSTRAGTGVIHNNTITGNYASLCVARTFRTYHSFTPWGQCNGESPFDVNDGTVYDSGVHTGSDGVTELVSAGKTWSLDQWKGYSIHNRTQGKSSIILENTATTIRHFADAGYETVDSPIWNNGDTFEVLRAYPCMDAPGRSTGDLVANDPPEPTSWPQQSSEPLYEWNNAIDGVDADTHSTTPDLKEGRDFINDTEKPGYTPYIYPHPLVVEEGGESAGGGGSGGGVGGATIEGSDGGSGVADAAPSNGCGCITLGSEPQRGPGWLLLSGLLCASVGRRWVRDSGTTERA